MTKRPIVYDVTHLVSRLSTAASSGIDRVDLAYGLHFAADDRLFAGAHHGLTGPHLLSAPQTAEIVAMAAAPWRAPVEEGEFSRLLSWLSSQPASPFAQRRATADHAGAAQGLARRLSQLKFRFLRDRRLEIPGGAVYLSAAQHLFEYPVFFRWLAKRGDIRKVFLLHDLLPLDFPEYFRPRNLAVFRRRLSTAFRHGDAFITSTQVVRARLKEELARQGLPDRPIHVQPFGSPLEQPTSTQQPAELAAAHPYFMMVGTIEPRKNHMLVLHIWRELLAKGANAPRLVLVGVRGWENEQVVDTLDRSIALRAHVVELSRLPSAHLMRLLQGARALLAPSFDEGYGLPVVEALSLGAPVIASDIPTFREVTRGCANLLSPLDGPAWRAEISRLAGEPEYHRRWRAAALRFQAPTWRAYFDGVDSFLASL